VEIPRRYSEERNILWMFNEIKKFLRCANAILRIDGCSDELVMLQLLETHCVPLLTYGEEVIHVSNRDEKCQLRVAYNFLQTLWVPLVC